MKQYEVFGDAKWVCAGEYAGFAHTADENGTPLKLWNEKENWAAEFF